jgi:hypothetical protein
VVQVVEGLCKIPSSNPNTIKKITTIIATKQPNLAKFPRSSAWAPVKPNYLMISFIASATGNQIHGEDFQPGSAF